jgi:hypothetical protein
VDEAKQREQREGELVNYRLELNQIIAQKTQQTYLIKYRKR